MQINPIPAFTDNYIWSLENKFDNSSVIVDPGDAAVVLEYLEQNNRELSAILITHHHRDHIGGVEQLLRQVDVPVYAPAVGNYGFKHTPCSDNDIVHVGCDLRVLAVPGHTLDHIAYVGEGFVFCGDTLFAGGCGRIFEGTAEMMHASLQKLAALPAETNVYCAHEYTLANLAFAQTVEPENMDLKERVAIEREKREQGLPTVPSTVGLELKTNPFLRVGCEEFVIVRKQKDCF